MIDNVIMYIHYIVSMLVNFIIVNSVIVHYCAPENLRFNVNLIPFLISRVYILDFYPYIICFLIIV